jgi:hypothetical protein
MKHLMLILALVIAASPALAARKPCEELKAEIDAKIRKNGLEVFTLEIVPNAEAKEVKDGQIVGSCDGGTKKIIFKR